ncbi:right-handed parallel beta-helix repeat-containing protein [Halobaculum litoreum]|uniref:Right-handed parallel beta-helix repeat-containing protein n=1 Tax=Halobaculum litoreum TaxID=3031998 RepID=A0ABD5XWZ6_9EURY
MGPLRGSSSALVVIVVAAIAVTAPAVGALGTAGVAPQSIGTAVGIGPPVPVPDPGSGDDARRGGGGVPTKIDACRAITEPGRYVLVADLSMRGSKPCLHVRASDVTIDGDGHTVSGDGSPDSMGLLVFEGERGGDAPDDTPLENVTVSDLRFSGFADAVRVGDDDAMGTQVTLAGVAVANSQGGISMLESEDSTLRNVTVEGGRFGVYLLEVRDLLARNLTVRSADTGVFLSDTVSDSRFVDLTAVGNGEGVYLSDSVSDNAFVRARVVDNEGPGIRFADSGDNTVRDSVVRDNGDSGVVSDPAYREAFVNVTVANNAGPEFRVEEGEDPFRVRDVTVGDRFVLAPGSGEPTAFAGGVGVVATGEVPGGLDGTLVGEAGLAVRNVGAPVEVGVALDDAAATDVSLWANHDGSWVRMPNARVVDDRLVGTVAEDGVVVALQDGTDQTDGGSATQIDSCTAITEPGRYELTGDVGSDAADTCIDVRASDVTLDGNGYTVAGPGTGVEDSLGLRVLSPTDDERLTNVTVRGVRLSDWAAGVQAGPPVDSPGPRVEFVDVTVADTGGILLYGTDDSVLRNVTVTDGDTGMYVWETSNLTVEDSTVSDNDGRGLFLAQVVEDSQFRGSPSSATTAAASTSARTPRTTSSGTRRSVTTVSTACGSPTPSTTS